MASTEAAPSSVKTLLPCLGWLTIQASRGNASSGGSGCLPPMQEAVPTHFRVLRVILESIVVGPWSLKRMRWAPVALEDDLVSGSLESSSGAPGFVHVIGT